MDNTTYMCVWHLSLHTTLTYDTNRLCGLYIYICNLLSIFTGSCFACGISLPLCFIIAQIPKQKKTHGTQFFQIDAAGLFFPTVRRALFLVHACPVHTSWLGKDRIMDSLKRFVFSNEKISKFKKGREKIGLWIPLFVFFSKKNKIK